MKWLKRLLTERRAARLWIAAVQERVGDLPQYDTWATLPTIYKRKWREVAKGE